MIYLLLILWSLVGVIIGFTLILAEALPSKNNVKNGAVIVFCGPIFWLAVWCLLMIKLLYKWLNA